MRVANSPIQPNCNSKIISTLVFASSHYVDQRKLPGCSNKSGRKWKHTYHTYFSIQCRNQGGIKIDSLQGFSSSTPLFQTTPRPAFLGWSFSARYIKAWAMLVQTLKTSIWLTRTTVTGPVARFARQIAGQGYIVAAPSSYHEFTGPEPLQYDGPGTDAGNKWKVEKVRHGSFFTRYALSLDLIRPVSRKYLPTMKMPLFRFRPSWNWRLAMEE